MGYGLTYTDTIEQFTKHFPVTPEELEWIMGRGICEARLAHPGDGMTERRRQPRRRAGEAPWWRTHTWDRGEALLQACRDLGADYIFSSAGWEWAPVWEALARQAVAGTGTTPGRATWT